MTVYQCKGCGHIEFNAAPEKCLVCRAPKSSFAEAPDAIKKPANPAALTDGDKKHIPEIVIVKECGLIPNVGCTDVHVRVGAIEHVMEEKHYIVSIDYYIDYKFISRVWLSPKACHPACALHLNAPTGTVTVVENCNVHGNWMAEAKI